MFKTGWVGVVWAEFVFTTSNMAIEGIGGCYAERNTELEYKYTHLLIVHVDTV